MIKFEIDVKKKKLDFECSGELEEITVDAMACLRRAFDEVRATSEDAAVRMIGFILEQLTHPENGFYDEVDWDTWEEPEC